MNSTERPEEMMSDDLKICIRNQNSVYHGSLFYKFDLFTGTLPDSGTSQKHDARKIDEILLLFVTYKNYGLAIFCQYLWSHLYW